MTNSTRRRQRLSSTALLVIVLGITTGWTQAANPTVHRADAIAMPHEAATARQLAAIVASRHADLATHRASEACLASSARTLHQARVTASRAHAPAPAKAKGEATAAKAKAPVAKAPTSKYSGTNHFWFPGLGISRAVHLFPCSRKREPDDYLYRWGCAGRNNVYIMGHASSVLRRLHDAYLGGRLHVGMLAVYADGNGRVRTYRVTTWRVVSPENSEWAIASQRVPSMTIQTCIGLKRLNVRLVAIN